MIEHFHRKKGDHILISGPFKAGEEEFIQTDVFQTVEVTTTFFAPGTAKCTTI